MAYYTRSRRVRARNNYPPSHKGRLTPLDADTKKEVSALRYMDPADSKLKQLPTLSDSKKIVRKTISADDLDIWSRIPRSQLPSNRTVMKKAGKVYAQAVGLDDKQSSHGGNSDYEFLHLSPFFAGGLDKVGPQVRENLVVGTFGCNGYMCVFEDIITYLLKNRITNTIQLEIAADLMPMGNGYSDIATQINYKFSWDDNNFDVVFDPQNRERPPIRLYEEMLEKALSGGEYYYSSFEGRNTVGVERLKQENERLRIWQENNDIFGANISVKDEEEISGEPIRKQLVF